MSYDPINGVGYFPSVKPQTLLISKSQSVNSGSNDINTLTFPRNCIVQSIQTRVSWTAPFGGQISQVTCSYNGRRVQEVSQGPSDAGNQLYLEENYGFLTGTIVQKEDRITTTLIAGGGGAAVPVNFQISMRVTYLEI